MIKLHRHLFQVYGIWNNFQFILQSGGIDWRYVYICDRFEQKQACGCILTNPPHVTPLRPGSTVIDGFSKLIPQRIAVEISYLLVYCSWKSINNCGAGTQCRNVWWIRQGTPKRLLLLGAVTYVVYRISYKGAKTGQFFNHLLSDASIKRHQTLIACRTPGIQYKARCLGIFVKRNLRIESWHSSLQDILNCIVCRVFYT